MTIQDASLTQLDGGLGLASPNSDGILAVMGSCSSGTANTLYAYQDRDVAIAAHVAGPAIEAAVHHLDRGAKQVLVVPVATSTAGVAAAVVRSGGTSGPVMTIAGAPRDAYVAQVKITLGGAVATAKFQYSKDGGVNWSADQITAATFVVPGTGLTWSFPAGTYVVGETYSSTCTAPLYSASDFNTAFAAMLAEQRTPKLIHCVGSCTGADDAAKSSNTATLAAAIDAQMTAMSTARKWTCAVFEAPDVADAAVVTAFNTFVSSLGFVHGAGRFQQLLSYIDGTSFKRSNAWEYAARVAVATLSEDVSEVDPNGKFGPFRPQTRAIYGDERKTPLLDAARFITARTYTNIGSLGVPPDAAFLTDAITMASSTSDYSLAVNRFFANAALAEAYAWGLVRLSKKLRINPESGLIDELTARGLENSLRNQLSTRLGEHCSDISVQMIRTDNLLSTRRPRFKLRFVPFLYPKGIDLEFAYVNPARQTLLAA